MKSHNHGGLLRRTRDRVRRIAMATALVASIAGTAASTASALPVEDIGGLACSGTSVTAMAPILDGPAYGGSITWWRPVLMRWNGARWVLDPTPYGKWASATGNAFQWFGYPDNGPATRQIWNRPHGYYAVWNQVLDTGSGQWTGGWSHMVNGSTFCRN